MTKWGETGTVHFPSLKNILEINKKQSSITSIKNPWEYKYFRILLFGAFYKGK